MKRLVLAATAALLFAAPALAQSYGPGSYGRGYDPEVTGSLAPDGFGPSRTGRAEDRVGGNPAAEGNARDVNKPVPSFGNVSGGPLSEFE